MAQAARAVLRSGTRMWSWASAARCLAPAGAAGALLLTTLRREKRAHHCQSPCGLSGWRQQLMGRPIQCSESTTLSVITWNILAAPYTKYNWKFHRAGAAMECELQQQTRTRYSMAGRHLIERSEDVVLLQECEAAFFSPDMNSEASKINQQYHVFACHIGENPGTAVLVKRDGRAKLMNPHQKPLCVGGGGGCPTYVSTVVQLMVGIHPVTIASVHVPYWPVAKEEAIHNLNLLDGALTGRRLLIVGGDFNAGTTPPNEHLSELEANTLFGGLKRAKLAPGTMTGLTGDFSAQVVLDHIYTSQDLDIASARALAVPLNGGPYSLEGTGPADVIYASDHVPVLAHIKLGPKL